MTMAINVVVVTLVLLATAIVVCEGGQGQQGLVVQTKLGKVLGSVMTTDKNNEFYAFRGLPYARPPLKDLRFKAPLPADSWNYTLDGTHDAHDCMQYDFYYKHFTGDEDCLYLNVYTPALISYESAMPVMVFIYGGGFSSGSGSFSTYGPQRLLDKDIVLVTINYRVGALGFLSTGDSSSPGNYGLLDQVQALRWVRENIVSFGGDPNRVTIFGESAGSVSVFYHLLSPLSKGLFHGAILQSGAPLSMWAFNHDPLDGAATLGERLKCPTDCTTQLMECIRRHSAIEIVAGSTMVGMTFAPIKTSPVVDVKYGGSFVPDNPYLLLKENRINKVPVIGGITRDEGAFFHVAMSDAFGGVKNVNSTTLQFALPFFFKFLARGSEALTKAMDRVKKDYFATATTWQDNFEGYTKLYGDSLIAEDMDSALKLLVNQGVPTYAYKFTYRGEHGLVDQLAKGDDVINELKKYVGHGDDLQYLFQSEYFKITNLNQQDQQMADVVLALWTSFAKTGVPTLNGTAIKHPELHWNSPTPGDFQYLDLNLQSKMVKGNLTSNSWRKIYKEFILKQLYNADPKHPVIATTLGKIRGSILKSDKGANIYAFRGVPYAQPPIGSHRFEAPGKVIPWKGVLDATEDVPACIQVDFFTFHLIGDEDCLYTNVYTPKLPSAESKEKLPVMVFIFGGGFMSGSGDSTLYGPQRLLDKGVILVTFNYRLGPLGFFSTGDEVAPGNFGLLDQVELLRWVHDNIESFGGDPARVTIFGESAGSASVIFHLISPLSHGLFHGAIAQSGSPESSWALEYNPKEGARKMAAQLSCPANSSAELVACLRTKAALDIVYLAVLKQFTAEPTKKYVYHLKPVVDKFAGKNSFLPDHPNKIMADGTLERVPLLMGTVKDEGIMFYTYLQMLTMATPDRLKPENLEDLMDLMFPYKFVSEEESSNAAKAIRKEYFGKSTEGEKYRDIMTFSSILGDVELTYDVTNDVELLSRRGLNPYVYKMTYRGQHTYTDFDQTVQTYAHVPKDLNAVSHIDDLQYLFHLGYFVDAFNLTVEDQKMADVMLSLWTNFAKNKVPSLDGSDYKHDDGFVWTPSTAEKPCYLDLTPTPKIIDGQLSYKQEFWRSIFKKTSKHL